MIRTLARNSRGPDVLEVQKALNRRIYAGLVPDSDFGGNTEAAVAAFQRRYQLSPDGAVGSETRSVLFPLSGVTVHIVGAYARGDIPVSARNVATLGGTGRSNRFGGPLLASSDNLFAAADVPPVDPVAPPIPDFLKNLPTLKDPSSGTLADFKLPDGMLLPIPPLLTAPLQMIPGMKFDSQQLQPGAQFTTRPLFENKPGSPNPSGGFVLAFQSVLARNKEQPGHLEIAEGLQLGVPVFAKTSDGTHWSLQWFAQATWVDPFWQTGRWHFVQPFVQVSSQVDLKQGNITLGAGAFPVNISFDVVKDKISVFGQGGLVLGWDTVGQRVELGGQAILGANITIGAF